MPTAWARLKVETSRAVLVEVLECGDDLVVLLGRDADLGTGELRLDILLLVEE